MRFISGSHLDIFEVDWTKIARTNSMREMRREGKHRIMGQPELHRNTWRAGSSALLSIFLKIAPSSSAASSNAPGHLPLPGKMSSNKPIEVPYGHW
jgi:hypothetical protein